jgi:nucleotide-binding universal stress UspA family protein
MMKRHRKKGITMKPKVLLALDGSPTSLKAAEYVGKYICACGCVEITLYHVISMPPELSEHSGERKAGGEERLFEVLHEKQEDWLTAARERAEEDVFKPAKAVLKKNGIDEKMMMVRTKLDSEAHPEAALSIIQEAKKGGYEIVVLGRRGASMLKEFIFGSVACKVIHHLHGCSICIVE